MKSKSMMSLAMMILIFGSISTEICAQTFRQDAARIEVNPDKSLASAIIQRVEAEDMSLTNYQIESSQPSSYIKLTSSTGTAKFNFSSPSGRYDIDVRYLSERVGQNTYTMYIGNNQIVAWLGKDRDNKWHMLSEQRWHIPKNIAINKGDEIRVEALSENGSFVIFDYIKFTASARTGSSTQTNLITIYPEEYDHAIKNPLKGFRISTIYPPEYDQEIKKRKGYKPSKPVHDYGTLIKTYFKWDKLENFASDDVNKIKDACNARWRDFEKHNIKAIPRVYLAWPGQKEHWPEDMTPGDFTSDQFKERVIAFITKLGRAWDNDSRVAYVEMGIIGEWGEMEYPDTRDDIKELIAAQFNASFQNKLVMIRWPNTYNDHIYNFGYYWDSFAHHDQEYCGFHINNTAPKWKTAVIGGETAYNWGSAYIQPGKSPDESLKNPIHRNYIIDRIRKLHANHVGWISEYNQQDESVRIGADLMQKALGYRFVISEVTYSKKIDAGSELMVSFKLKNTGSSPFYYNWPVEVSLLDPNTKKAVWKNQCTDVDIRNWMPGDKWNDSTNTYTISAETNTINQTFPVSDIPSGEYILALAILDPAGNRPGARFAIKNYYTGGRHPIGKIGVNRTIDSFSINDFDDIQSDTSLNYEIDN